MKRLTECDIQFYGKQLAKGIKYLHDNGILHRDLKMGNILITKTNELVKHFE